MYGSLALHQGVLWVGREEREAHVRPFDLEGQPLGAGFDFISGARAAASGLAVDDDRCVWVADSPTDRLRGFNVFGSEVAGFGGARSEGPGAIARPVAVCARGGSDELELLVALGGGGLHAVQLFDREGKLLCRLRSRGSAEEPFQRPMGLARAGELTWVCEAGPCRVQVFRDLEYHHSFGTPGGAEPRALAPLPDGRLVLACGAPGGTGARRSALLLLDSEGRLLRTLAAHGEAEGEVFEPGDVVVNARERDEDSLALVIDRDAERVQAFDLEGRWVARFEELGG